MKIKKKS